MDLCHQLWLDRQWAEGRAAWQKGFTEGWRPNPVSAQSLNKKGQIWELGQRGKQ